MRTIRKIKIGRVLIIVDMQLDFMEGGSLEVKLGARLVKMINTLMATGEYDLIIVTQDWHPEDSYEFAVVHGQEQFSTVTRNGHVQMLFAVHCVQGTPGAMIHPALDMRRVSLILRKGMDFDVATHSVFFSAPNEAGDRVTTGLAEYLEAYDFDGIDLVGLAFDVCVKLSGLDGAALYPGKARVLQAYTASVFPENDEQTIKELEAAGVEVIR